MNTTIALTDNARTVLERRYLARDEDGTLTETPETLFRRVARCVAAVDRRYDPGLDEKEREDGYFSMMASLEFLPNSPTLMNAGRKRGQLSACFVIPVGDSIGEIFQAVAIMAAIHQTGGGTGFSFSRLRPRNDVVGNSGGIASGPVSFMRIFDQATEVVKQGGRRRGANMAVLRIDHPDIMEFVEAKRDPGGFRNFNLSVAVTDEFMDALDQHRDYGLVNPRTGLVVGKQSPDAVWETIAALAWETGDPGVLFIDRINREQPTPSLGPIEATNPCGEQPLLPFESCNLGSINLSKVVRNGSIDWTRLGELVDRGVRFLDNIIDANTYPVPEVKRVTLGNRKIGLGVMGLAEMLIVMGIPYGSDRSLAVAEELMAFIETRALAASEELGRRRGSFPNLSGSRWERKGYATLRNATLTTIAPTGTISILAGTSSGIEPLFALGFVRNVLDGTRLTEMSELFTRAAKEAGIDLRVVEDVVARRGSVADCLEIPQDMRELYRTAFDISPELHLRMQAVFQKYTHNAVSKTINLPHDAGPEEVAATYRRAYALGCKGVTVYRYGSRKEQVLSFSGAPATPCGVCRGHSPERPLPRQVPSGTGLGH